MFDFQRLMVYQKAKDFRKDSKELIQSNRFGRVVNDQFERAALSIPLNIAEGTSRFSKRDRKNFYTIARGSGFECASILDILSDKAELTTENANFQNVILNDQEIGINQAALWEVSQEASLSYFCSACFSLF